MSSPTPFPSPRTTGSLEEIGLYNLLNRVARGDATVDDFLLHNLRLRGFVELDALALSEAGCEMLRALAIQLGWFFPDD